MLGIALVALGKDSEALHPEPCVGATQVAHKARPCWASRRRPVQMKYPEPRVGAAQVAHQGPAVLGIALVAMAEDTEPCALNLALGGRRWRIRGPPCWALRRWPYNLQTLHPEPCVGAAQVAHQGPAVLGIALVAMAEDLGSTMAHRALEHLLQYGEPAARCASQAIKKLKGSVL